MPICQAPPHRNTLQCLAKACDDIRRRFPWLYLWGKRSISRVPNCNSYVREGNVCPSRYGRQGTASFSARHYCNSHFANYYNTMSFCRGGLLSYSLRHACRLQRCSMFWVANLYLPLQVPRITCSTDHNFKSLTKIREPQVYTRSKRFSFQGENCVELLKASKVSEGAGRFRSNRSNGFCGL